MCGLDELKEKKPFTVECAGVGVGVILFRGNLYAYENRCAHMGGPVCLGSVFGRVRVALNEVKMVVNEYESTQEACLVCPWHGFEYDLVTGECIADRSYRLNKLTVRTDNNTVYVELPTDRSEAGGRAI